MGGFMRLKNKKTGEIGYPYFQNWKNISCTIVDENAIQIAKYTSLAELNAEWEDYEEPKEYWYICSTRNYEVTKVVLDEGTDFDRVQKDKEIGNYFETIEEAELAVEKLKAWKRLKDRNLRFNLNYSTGGATINHKDVIMCWIEAYFDDKWEEDNMKAEEDLDLLLGGEE